MRELSISELERMEEDSFLLIDIRSEANVQYGMIPGAVHIPETELLEDAEQYALELAPGKTLVVYCQRGFRSMAVAQALADCGRESVSLAGGYLAYLREKTSETENDRERQEKAEDSIRGKFHKQLFSPFAKACKQYRLIQDGDRIAVCISGGKDSMLMAKLFQELQRHRKVSFELVFLVMDPGYNSENRRLIERNARSLGIPITIFESTIFDTVEKNPCYLCARMRRGYCDDAHEVLCRLESRQVEKTKVDEEAQNVFYIVQGNAATPDELLQKTAQRIIDLTTRYCGGRGEVIVPTVI